MRYDSEWNNNEDIVTKKRTRILPSRKTVLLPGG